MATVTSTKVFYPSAGATVERAGVNQTFSNIRSGAGTTVSTPAVNTDVLLFSSSTTNQFKELDRVIILFDTSTLPANATITSASITIAAYGVITNMGSTTMELVSSNPASNTNIVAADYSTLGSTSFASISQASISTSSPTVFTLNSSGISNISIGGISKFGFILGWDLNGSFTGTWANPFATGVDFGTTYTLEGMGFLSVTYTQPTLSIANIGSTISNISSITTS